MKDVVSRSYLEDAASRGDPFAEFELAIAYDYGRGVPQSYQTSAQLYASASEHGHGCALHNLTLQHILGQVSFLPREQVFADTLRAAEAGDSDAQCSLGLCYEKGYGTEQDYRQSVSWYRRSARSGNSTAQFNLGGAYLKGTGARKNIQSAIVWYTKAAQQRHDLALVQLGHMQQKGIGFPVDHQRAFVLYLCAYRAGSTRAANHLGFLFRNGLGVEADYERAYQLFLESVSSPDTGDIGYEPSYRRCAYYYLGLSRELGQGVERNLEEAIEWYRKGAEVMGTASIKALERLVPQRRPRHSRHRDVPDELEEPVGASG